MKSFSAGLVTLLNSEVMTIATLVRITRQDGTILRFTDHDKDVHVSLNVSSPGAFETFEASTGLSRSTLVQKSDLSVDDTDAKGIKTLPGVPTFEPNLITDDDLLAGRYDHARVQIWIINWISPFESGLGALRKGRLGQVSLGDTSFTTEMRGLTQALQVQVGEVYAPLCRVDLFSTACSLIASQFVQSGVVSAVTSNRLFDAAATGVESRDPVPARLPAGVAPSDPVISDRQKVDFNEDGTLVRNRAAGDGSSEAKPILVTTTTELNNIRNDPSLFYALDNNINMTGFGNWTPIPTLNGEIDGRGYEIQNLDLDDTSLTVTDGNYGFVGLVSERGKIRRIGFTNCNLALNAASTSVNAGVIAGLVTGTIEDCYVVGGNVTFVGNGSMGGAIGKITRATTPSIVAIPGAVTEPPARVRRIFSAQTFTGVPISTEGAVVGVLDDVDSQGDVGDLAYDSTVAGFTQDGAGAIALTTAQAQVPANFPSGFDFVNAWKDNSGGPAYPTLLNPGRCGSDPCVRFIAIDLSGLVTYASGNIAWTSDEPGLTSIVVSIATDGETFTAVTNGGALPGFTVSQSLTGVNMTVRVDFQSLDTNEPTLNTFTITVNGEVASFPDVPIGPPPPVALTPSDVDWFVAGTLTWTTGLNAGLSMEIKGWIPASRTFQLYLEMPFTVQPGDKFDAFPGCRHRVVEDCGTKFNNVVNFRAEPFIPGIDVLFATPDSQTTSGSNSGNVDRT